MPVDKIITISLLLATLISPQLQATTFKVASVAPDGSFWMDLMRQGAEQVSKQTDGRVNFRFYPGGVMGSQETVLRKMRIGQLHGGAFTSGVLASLYPDSQIYSLPLTFRSVHEIDYVRDRMDAQIIDGLDDSGLVTLGISEGGMVYTMSEHAVLDIGDFKHCKVWSPTNNRNVALTLEAIDITPVPLPLSDVLVGLQTGLIDTVASSPSAAIALQWHTEISYITDVPLMYFYSVLALDEKAFKRLSETDRATVKTIMGETISKIDKQNRISNVEALAALKNQGIEILKPDTSGLTNWYQKGSRATDMIFHKGEMSDQAIDQLLGYIEEFRARQAKLAPDMQ